ncbi:MAG: chromosome segregation protein SMC [Deltaproteobacteria bacterium CG11_big_fil_rev_8_21_14_0_20_49_13]|nr:MAG: chromosome segregation protein SMC [Deltaproteobacteria bacterium CG11_big_fil_rev_8_21_14_0_20_49_13]
MRLKSLELIGFKSFVDRTVITFDAGITSVVGPNGSGKSNVVDSIRWVMGEQSAKHLRGHDMSDVIFNGSEARPATGMASVFLTFDNADGRAPAEYASYSEITIGRRLYRSGESEYYINKVPCRHKDIIEFFLGTGVGTKAYSIVEQGQVERIVSAKPEERRSLLEEAAGISKFKMHRDSALRKIEATKLNLARLADIISELESQKNSLSRQAKKAERYKIFADELKKLELSLASYQYKTWSEELSVLRTKLSSLSEDEASRGASVSNEETSIDSMRLELTETERRLNSLQERIYELQNRMRLNEAEVKFKTESLSQLRTRCEDDSQEITELKGKLETFTSELSGVNGSKVNADIKLASFEETVASIQERAAALTSEVDATNSSIESFRQEVVLSIRAISESKARLEQIDKQDADIAGAIARNQTEIDTIDKKVSELEGGMVLAEGALTDMKGTKEGISQEMSALENNNQKIKNEVLHNEASLNDIKQMFSSKSSRLVSLEELSKNFEGYEDGVRAVLKRKNEAVEGEFSGVFGTISEVIETEPAYEAAVSAALGGKLQYVVVKSYQEGVAAIDYLKTASAGRSTFVPLEVRESVDASPMPTGEGVMGPLLDHVKFTDDYQKIGKYLFNDIVLVSDLDKALGVWQGNGHSKTLVTLDGEMVDPYGVVSGGSGSDSSRQFLAQKREIGELKGETARLGEEIDSKNELVSDLRRQVQVNEARLSQLKSAIHQYDVDFVHKERDVQGIMQQISNWRKDRDRLTVETAALAEKKELAAHERTTLTSKVAEAEEKQRILESDITRLTAEVEEKRNSLGLVSDELTAKKVQLAASQEQSLSLERETKRLSESIHDVNNSIASKKADIVEANIEIEQNTETLEAAKEEIGILVKDIEVSGKEQTELKLAYDRSLEDLRNKEVGLRELRKTFEETKNSIYELKLQETKSTERVFYLEREMQEKYHTDLATKFCGYDIESCREFFGKEEISTVSELSEKISVRATELKDKIEKIGAVNTDAIGEYEGIAQRYEFLTKQSEDLNSSIESLQKAIIRINRTSKERFVETFNAVNERFKALFPRLFHGGGRAELILIDNENVLESGIDIIAQPPGKKLQNVSLLSGGEKALVATTFIFSIFLIKPSPFCLLDEVDAPLDDANIDRFNQLVREMSRLSQFIMITHNRRSMELADTLYGVTMEEPGISKIVSVKLEQQAA